MMAYQQEMFDQQKNACVSRQAAALRPYQQAAVDTAIKHGRGLLVLPTGSGKSHVIAGIVNKIAGKTLILQPTKEILESNYEKIVNAGFRNASIYSASVGIKEIGQATYATIGSIINCLELFEDCEAVIIDEAHLVNAKGGQYDDLVKYLDSRILIGLTATPYRLYSNRDWGSQIKMLHRTRPRIFKSILHVTQCSELANQGYLVSPEFHISDSGNVGLLQANSTGADYTDESLERYLRDIGSTERITVAASTALDEGVSHVLVFTPFLHEAAEAVKALNGVGISADMVSGKMPMPERAAKLHAFRTGGITAVVNVGVLTTGYDFPQLDCIISARPTMSLALYYQIIGRGVRPATGKSKTLVFDLVDNHKRFGDPMEMALIRDDSGQYDVLSRRGRLTTRWLHEGPEVDEQISFGKHRGKRLADLPLDYLKSYCAKAKMSARWHQFNFEIKRREIYGDAMQEKMF